MISTSKLLGFCALLISPALFAQPTNDNCANATTILVGSECVAEEFTSIDATAEPLSVASNPSCGLYQGGDVWFNFVVPASGNFRIDVDGNYWTLSTGSCGSFTEIFCDNAPMNFSRPDLAEQTLYIRAYRFNNGAGSDFELCVYEINPPSNDNCADATSLTVGATCVYEDFSSVESTAEDLAVAPNPSCGIYKGGDVWFSFEVPLSGNFRVDVAGNYWTLYSGSCGDFSQINCDNIPQNYSRPDLAGQTLTLRAFRFNSRQGDEFSVCISEIDPPANDNCANAVELSVGETCVYQEYSSIESTAEDLSVAPNPSCGLYKGGDVWFSFEVPLSGNFRVDVTGNYWTLYSGSCGNFSEINCDNNPLNYSRPDLAGQTLYLRAYRFNSRQGDDFSVCISEINPPANDNCANATSLAVGETCTFQDFSSIESTAEGMEVAPSPSCGLYKGGDVWFTFEVPSSGQFRIEMGGTYWALYQGSCGSFTQLTCENAPLNFDDPSLAGETLYLRAYRFNNRQGEDFEACIWEIDVPENNHCANATELNYSDTCLAAAFSSQFATAEATDVADNPSCGLYKGGDVWFQFQAPPMGAFTLNVPEGSQQLAFYTGSCGDFTEILCTSDDEITFDDPSLASETIYVRAYRFNNRQGSDFELCLLTNEVAPNDNCSDAITLLVGESCNYQTFDSYNATDEMDLASDPSCGNYQGDDVWFKFDVPADGRFAIQTLNEVGNFTYSLYSGTCGDFGDEICASNPEQTLYDNAALAGETLYMRVFNINSTIGGEFSICIAEYDCNNTVGGSAYFDNCDDCVGGNTGLLECVDLEGSAEDINPACGDIDMTIAFYEVGTATLVELFDTSIGGDGSFYLQGVPQGTFDIFVRIEGRLQKGYLNQTLASSINNLSLGAFVRGDISGDNNINIVDFSILNASFGLSEGDPNFLSLADMNCDGSVNIVDVSILNTGFGMSGDSPGTP